MLFYGRLTSVGRNLKGGKVLSIAVAAWVAWVAVAAVGHRQPLNQTTQASPAVDINATRLFRETLLVCPLKLHIVKRQERPASKWHQPKHRIQHEVSLSQHTSVI